MPRIKKKFVQTEPLRRGLLFKNEKHLMQIILGCNPFIIPLEKLMTQVLR